MEMKVDRAGTLIVLSLDGSIDVTSAPPLRAQLDQLLAHASPKLLVDLAAVPYVDSYGLGILMQAVKLARREGGDLRLCAPHPQVRTLLEVTGFSKLVSIAPSLSQALASWANERWKTPPG